MVEVYVWNYSRQALITKNGNIGHSSMQVGADYISWWPGAPVPNLAEDRHLEGRSPDHTITIPHGLDEAAIRLWWSRFRGSNEYDLVTLNCSTVVGTALKAGGAMEIASLAGRAWHSWNFIWDPDDVRRLAESLRNARVVRA